MSEIKLIREANLSDGFIPNPFSLFVELYLRATKLPHTVDQSRYPTSPLTNSHLPVIEFDREVHSGLPSIFYLKKHHCDLDIWCDAASQAEITAFLHYVWSISEKAWQYLLFLDDTNYSKSTSKLYAASAPTIVGWFLKRAEYKRVFTLFEADSSLSSIVSSSKATVKPTPNPSNAASSPFGFPSSSSSSSPSSSTPTGPLPLPDSLREQLHILFSTLQQFLRRQHTVPNLFFGEKLTSLDLLSAALVFSFFFVDVQNNPIKEMLQMKYPSITRHARVVLLYLYPSLFHGQDEAFEAKEEEMKHAQAIGEHLPDLEKKSPQAVPPQPRTRTVENPERDMPSTEMPSTISSASAKTQQDYQTLKRNALLLGLCTALILLVRSKHG